MSNNVTGRDNVVIVMTDKLEEELLEFSDACRAYKRKPSKQRALEVVLELGDVLFCCAALHTEATEAIAAASCELAARLLDVTVSAVTDSAKAVPLVKAFRYVGISKG